MPGQLITDIEFAGLQDLALMALGGACQIQRSAPTPTASGGQNKNYSTINTQPYALALPTTPTELHIAQELAPKTVKVIMLPANTDVKKETDQLLLDTGDLYHIVADLEPVTYEMLRRVSVVLSPLQGRPS